MFITKFTLRKNKTIFLVNNNKEAEEFETDKFFSNKSLPSVEDPDRTEILDCYINEFKLGDKLMKLYKEAKDTILETNSDIKPVIEKIVKLFDYEKYLYVLEEYGFQPPEQLKAELDMSAVRNARISAEQTYTKRQYLELLPIIGIIKAIGPVLANDVKDNPGKYKFKAETLSLALMVLELPLPKKPIEKILAYIEKHLTSVRSKDEIILSARRKKSSSEDIIYIILGNMLFNRFLPVPIERQPEDASLITIMYSAVTSGSSVSTTTKDSVRLKSLYISPDTGEKESWAESSRQTSTMTLDQPENYNFIAGDLEGLLRDFDIPDRLEEALSLKRRVQPLLEELSNGRRHRISQFSIRLLSLVVTKTLPLDAIQTLTRENLVNLLIVAYLYFQELGFKELAPYLLLIPDYEGKVRTPSTIHHIDKDLLEDLDNLYPNSMLIKLKGKNKGFREEPLYTEPISQLVDDFKGEQYDFLLDTEYSQYGVSAIPYPTIKSDIARLLIRVYL